jgi:phosphotransferase system  glucose/maltose/N-acetylglucosamine-specific IIC component
MITPDEVMVIIFCIFMAALFFFLLGYAIGKKDPNEPLMWWYQRF